MGDPDAGKRTTEFFKSLDEYRKHPMLNNNLRRATPGLGIAVAAFAVYLFVDGMATKLGGKGGHESHHH